MTDPNNTGTPSGDPTPPPPAYGQPAPTYGQPAPGYGQSPQTPPGYPSAPGYGAAPAYNTAPGYGGYAAPRKTNTLALVSLISSIAAFVIVPFIGSIVGIITGHMSLSQIKRTGEQGHGLGLAGTIVGWVGLGLAILGTILLIAWAGWFYANFEEYRTM